MGYRVLTPMEQKYQPRKGLEGPFNFSGRVLYYDAKEGKYYDPTTDFYVDDEEMNMVHQRLVDCLVR